MNKHLKQLKKEAFDIKRKNSMNYSYEYYTNVDGNLIRDVETCELYGDTRAGYERWKNRSVGKSVGYAGETSARMIHEIGTNKLIGCIMETSLPDDSWKQELEQKWEEAWSEYVATLKIQNKKLVEYFLFNDGGCDWSDRTENIQRRIEKLIESVEEYYSDDDYKVLLDKIR